MRERLKITQQLWERLIKFRLELIYLNKMNPKEVVLADRFSVTGSLNSIKDCWDKLTAIWLLP